MESQERARILMSALEALLAEEGWTVDPATVGLNVLAARFGDGNAVRFVVAGGSPRGAPGLTVEVHDDGCGFEAREDWVGLQWIASNAGSDAVAHSRFGWDLVFAFRNDSALIGYRNLLGARFVGTTTKASDQTAPCANLILKHHDRTRLRPLDIAGVSDYVLRVDASPAVREEGCRNALIAVNGCVAGQAMDQAHFLVSELVFEHLARLARGDCITCLPLFLAGEEIRSQGLDASIRVAFWTACGRSYSQELYRLVMQLGFVHLYIANSEQLRSDQDFDPNTRFITEILAACEGDGRFTLACARDYVFHADAPPAVANEATGEGERWELGALRTLGQRFFLSEAFCIVDFGAPRREHFALLDAYANAELSREVAQISRLSGSRCSPEEARLALRNLAFVQTDREAGILSRADLRNVAEDVLTDTRRRPAHVAFVEEALAQSATLREVGAGRFAFRDTIVRDHLTAATIAQALRYALIVGRFKRLRKAFSRRIVDASIFELACHIADIGAMPDIATAIPTLPPAFMLNEGPSPEMQVPAENALRFLFAAADYLVAARPELWRDRRAFFEHLCKDAGPIVMAGVALPQFTFRGISMQRWSIKNCNLRSCVIVDCNLSDLRVLDSFLGGAVIKHCVVDEYVKFEESNLSGSWIGGKLDTAKLFNVLGSLRDRFKHSNWTLSSIGGSGVDGEQAEDIFAFLTRQGGSIVNLTLHDSRGGPPHPAPSPPEFQAALLQNLWGEDVVIDDIDPQRSYVRRADAAVGAREGGPDAVKAIARATFRGAQGRCTLLAVDERGNLWSTGGSAQAQAQGRWRTARAPEPLVTVERFDAFDQDDADPAIRAAAVVTEGSSRRIVLLEADEVAEDLRFSATSLPLRSDDSVTAMLWVRETRSADPCLYLGFESGAVEKVARDPQSHEWASSSRVRSDNSAVGALCFARRSKVLVAAYRNGLTIGLQSAADQSAPPLFSFKTALVRVYDIVYLEGSGDQMILVGSTRAKGAPPLCVLFNAAGDVLAVFPNDPPALAADANELALPAVDQAPLGTGSEATDAANSIKGELQDHLNGFQLDRSRAEVRPLSDNELDRILVIRLRGGTGDALDAAIETPDGPAFRHVQVNLSAAARDGTPVMPVQACFTDRELEFPRTGESNIELRVPVAFSHDTETAHATLQISYKSGAELLASRPIDIDIDVLWRENPYEAGGKAALGSRFFGRLSQIENCSSQLARGNGVVVRAARRMGKSSFLGSVAQRLADHGHLAVVLSLAGSARPRAELATLIARGAADPLSPVAPAVAQRLQKELSKSAPRGRQALDKFAELAKSLGFKLPAVALIDEWGVISNPASALFDEPFEQEIGELVQGGPANTPIAVCLASAPDDFVYRKTSHQSDFYRGFDNRNAWIDLGPLNDDELRSIMTVPIQNRAGGFRDARATFGILKRLSSGDPYAANVIMARAYELALARSNAAGSDGLKIEPEDLENEIVERDLSSIYDVHLGYTFDRLSKENQRLFADDCAAATPPWQKVEVPVPHPLDDPRQWDLFSRAGFRRPRDPGMRDSRFDLWIPYGFSLNVARRITGGE